MENQALLFPPVRPHLKKQQVLRYPIIIETMLNFFSAVSLENTRELCSQQTANLLEFSFPSVFSSSHTWHLHSSNSLLPGSKPPNLAAGSSQHPLCVVHGSLVCSSPEINPSIRPSLLPSSTPVLPVHWASALAQRAQSYRPRRLSQIYWDMTDSEPQAAMTNSTFQ